MKREEAINTVRNIYQTDKEKEALETLIPELRESEDERIRRGLVKLLTVAGEAYVVNSTGIKKDSYLAYLEKQKEQNQKITVKIPKFRVGDIIQHVPLESWDRSRKINAIDKDGYYVDMSHLGDNVSGGFIGFSFEDEYELVEQKLAEWSEEDKENLLCVRGLLKHYLSASYKGSKYWDDAQVDELLEWTKNLPNRFQIQPKQEWSEEERKILDSIIGDYEKAARSFCGYAGKIWFLKAIRDGEYNLPKQEWSEEDERMFYEILAYLRVREENGDFHANAMHNWFKSLRPQPKPAWSEEDEKLFWEFTAYVPNEELERLGVTRDDILKKLKSLRPLWKPIGSHHLQKED